MERITPYFGIVAAVLIGAFIIYFSGKVPVSPAPVVAPPAASSTLSVVPAFSLPPLAIPSLPAKNDVATTAPTTTPATPVPVIPKKVPPVVATPVPVATTTPAVTVPEIPATIPPAPLVPSGNIGLDATASALRGALVNILCFVPVGSRLHSISGSGVIIDSKGIVLTNAHIAQYFLLADRSAQCSVRTGSPAMSSYNASLIFISPAWLRANSSTITQVEPTGTGEFDFALVAITKSTTATALPSTFPSIPLADVPPLTGTQVVIASYGAQFLNSSQVQTSLFPTVVFGSVKDVFTFALNTIDVLALGGSAAAQEGSSGGGVADALGKLVGTITTSTILGATDTRSLDAITASYIRSDYASETGRALDLLLAEPTSSAIADFAPQIPPLESILTAQLQ